MESFCVRISSDELVFSAGHFITLEGGVCERLHGHDYRLAAEVHGPLNEQHYVVDFVAVRDSLRAIVGELDHRVLLPTEHPSIRVNPDEEEVEVRFAERRWVFPRSECLLLPIASTTSELLAQYIGKRLLGDLASIDSSQPESVRIEVHEGGGYSAVCELSVR